MIKTVGHYEYSNPGEGGCRQVTVVFAPGVDDYLDCGVDVTDSLQSHFAPINHRLLRGRSPGRSGIVNLLVSVYRSLNAGLRHSPRSRTAKRSTRYRMGHIHLRWMRYRVCALQSNRHESDVVSAQLTEVRDSRK